MRLLFIIQLILLFSFSHSLAQQQQSLPIKSTTEIDKVLASYGENIAFYGRIYSFETLGDSVLILKCGEYKTSKKSILVILKSKDALRMPSSVMLAGKWVIVQGTLEEYNEVPAIIIDHRINNATVKVEDLSSIPKQAIEEYQSKTHLDPLYKLLGRRVAFLGTIVQAKNINDSVRIISCKEFLPTRQTLNVVLLGRQFQGANDKKNIIGMGLSLQGRLTTYNDTLAMKFGKDSPDTRLTVFKMLDNTTNQAVLYDQQKQILYIK